MNEGTQPRNAEFVPPADEPKPKRYQYRRVDEGDQGGEYVTQEYAEAHPNTTVREEVIED